MTENVQNALSSAILRLLRPLARLILKHGMAYGTFAELARKAGKPSRLMIDATHLKAHRTAASLLKNGLFPDVSGAPRAA